MRKKCVRNRNLFFPSKRNAESICTQRMYILIKCTRECDFAMQKQCSQTKQTKERERERKNESNEKRNTKWGNYKQDTKLHILHTEPTEFNLRNCIFFVCFISICMYILYGTCDKRKTGNIQFKREQNENKSAGKREIKFKTVYDTHAESKNEQKIENKTENSLFLL